MTAPRAVLAALGAVLVDGRRYDDVAAIVGSDWYRHAHGLIWAAIGRVVAAGDPVDLLTVKAALGADLDPQPRLGPSRRRWLLPAHGARASSVNAATIAIRRPEGAAAAPVPRALRGLVDGRG